MNTSSNHSISSSLSSNHSVHLEHSNPQTQAAVPAQAARATASALLSHHANVPTPPNAGNSQLNAFRAGAANANSTHSMSAAQAEKRLLTAALTGDVETVNQMLAINGVNFDVRATNGITAAHFAALNGSVTILQRLQQAGANMQLERFDGMTPLHFAIHEGNIHAADYLIQQGFVTQANSSHSSLTPAVNKRLRERITNAIATNQFEKTKQLSTVFPTLIRQKDFQAAIQHRREKVAEGLKIHMANTVAFLSQSKMLTTNSGDWLHQVAAFSLKDQHQHKLAEFMFPGEKAKAQKAKLSALINQLS